MYRRREFFNTNSTSWERVVINRENQTAETHIIGPNPDSSIYTIEKNIYTDEGDKTILNCHVYDPQGKGLAKIENFKD